MGESPQLTAISLPILVASCDKYADVWPHFFSLFRLRWADCPFPVFLGSNRLRPEIPGVMVIPIGDDISWSRGINRMLDVVQLAHPEAEYILLLLEDFFLTAPVSSARISDLARCAHAAGLGSLRLAAGLPLAIVPTQELAQVKGVGIISRGDEYRVTLQAAIWRIQTLRQLLSPGLSAWDFEIMGTQMAEGFDDIFWGVLEPAIAYDHAIEKGKWKPAGLAILADAGIDVGELTRDSFSDDDLAAHIDRGRAEALAAHDRSAALKNFLLGHRLAGLRCFGRRIRAGSASAAEVGLAIVGILGASATRRALSFYVELQLRGRARRERATASGRSISIDPWRRA